MVAMYNVLLRGEVKVAVCGLASQLWAPGRADECGIKKETDWCPYLDRGTGSWVWGEWEVLNFNAHVAGLGRVYNGGLGLRKLIPFANFNKSGLDFLIQFAFTSPTVTLKFGRTSSRRCSVVAHSGVQSLMLKCSVGSCCRPGMSTLGSAGGQD
eukprot:1152277-Pelagomonas_calceolata.AAC.1